MLTCGVDGVRQPTVNSRDSNLFKHLHSCKGHFPIVNSDSSLNIIRKVPANHVQRGILMLDLQKPRLSSTFSKVAVNMNNRTCIFDLRITQHSPSKIIQLLECSAEE